MRLFIGPLLHLLKLFLFYNLHPSYLFQTSFLIPPEAVAGRLTLLVTLFLVLISILNTVIINSPNVEGLTSISTWVITCILFVFGALSAFALTTFWKIRLGKVCLNHSFVLKLIFFVLLSLFGMKCNRPLEIFWAQSYKFLGASLGA
jgi:hypothetical protein